jgi:hypothetical protein
MAHSGVDLVCDCSGRAFAVLIPIWVMAGWLCASGCGGRSVTIDAGGASATTAGTGNEIGGGGASASGTPTPSPPPLTGVGGVSGTAGNAGSMVGGSASTGAAGNLGLVLCNQLITQAGIAPSKAGPCVATDPQFCYKTCGPQSTGFKSETCLAGAYVEQAGCSYPPDGDFSCYKIPAVLDSSCPAATPQASTACTLPQCIPCADSAGTYLDSTGAPHVGYCVCPAPGPSGISKWSCSSAQNWPCPTGRGC